MIISSIEYLSDNTDETKHDIYPYHCFLPYGGFRGISLFWNEEEQTIQVETRFDDYAPWLL